MTPPEIHQEAIKLGLRLEPAGDKLAVFPKGVCPPDFAAILRQHRVELLNWLSSPPCPGWQAVPPGDLPLSADIPHPKPAQREMVIAYLLRQTGDRSSKLGAWLVLRESAYYDGPGRRWDCGLISYCAARDAACWQLQLSEAEIWCTLSGWEEWYGLHHADSNLN